MFTREEEAKYFQVHSPFKLHAKKKLKCIMVLNLITFCSSNNDKLIVKNNIIAIRFKIKLQIRKKNTTKEK